MGLKMNLEQTLNEITGKMYGKNIGACTDAQLYTGVLQLTKEKMAETPVITGDKKVYYISMEFLIGKLLSNNLINLGIYEELSDILKKNGKNLADIEEAEPEPSLGNGGLGRLAACFLDSIATLGLPGDGIGLNYHFGLFKQVFKDHLQNAEKNDWIQKDSWLNNTGTKFEVAFGDRKVTSVLYDIDVVGYENGLNKLHLFDIETVDESLVKKGITFDKEAIEKNLTLFLYPDDSDEAGNLLRIYQEYFMVCNGAQLILKEVKEKGYDLHTLPEHVAIQINDTHPTMVIPELIRILTTEEGFTMDEAIDVVSHTCAYTNHTILAEALEKWPLAYIEKVVPQLVPIIKELSNRVAKKYKDEKVQIIDKDKRVHMAHIDIHYGYSVNGVAAIHTEILKQSELNHFYKIYPEKFNNKTNGITFRRWLLSCNHELAAFLSQTIGDGYKKDADELQKLLEHKEDQAVLDAIYDIKKTKKTELLFLALFLRMLKVGGRCAVIVPDGVLFGSSTAHKAIRKEIVEGNRLEAVISIEIRGQRAADCEQGCETAAEVLLGRLPAGIRPGELNWEALTWERETGLFLRRGRLRGRADFLARAEEGDTGFLDFRLKGAVTT